MPFYLQSRSVFFWLGLRCGLVRVFAPFDLRALRWFGTWRGAYDITDDVKGGENDEDLAESKPTCPANIFRHDRTA